MPKPTAESIAATLTVPERILFFCLASDTDWQKASITHATAQHMMVRGLIERDRAATRYVLTEQGRAVLAALLGSSVQKKSPAHERSQVWEELSQGETVVD